MRQRFKKVGIQLAAALLIGCIYAMFVRYTGFAVPCMFYEITGLKCPSCGVTRMSISILDLDFKTAYLSNQMLFLLSPLLVFLFGSYVLKYIKTGRWSLSKFQMVICAICIGLLLLFGIFRNVYGL